jgi:DHA2 family multidrug resistance protein-like MFS transporter
MLIVAMLLTGAMGATPALMTHTVVNNYPEDRRGVGAALNSAVLRFGMAFGVAAYGALLTSTFLRGMADVGPAVDAAGVETDFHSLGGALRAAQDAGGPQAAALESAAREAFVDGFSLVMLAGALILVAVGMLIRATLPRHLSTSPQPPKVDPEAEPQAQGEPRPDPQTKPDAGPAVPGSSDHDERPRS